MAHVIPDGGDWSPKSPSDNKDISGNKPYNVASRVFKNYGYTVTQAYSSEHAAIDLVATSSDGFDHIVAHSTGVVTFCQSGYSNAIGYGDSNASYGNCVMLEHNNGYSTLYAHMEYISVGNGQRVAQGQILGRMGNTGNSYGAHLHFEVRNKSGKRLNPTKYVNGESFDLGGDNSAANGNSTNKGSSGGGYSRKSTVEITNVVVKSTDGKIGERVTGNLAETKMLKTGYEILIQNGNKIMMPVLTDDISLEWSRKNAPGCLEFTCVKDKNLNFTEGNAVSFRVEGKNVFFGFVFEKSHDDPDKISVTCYDQLRYLKNKGTMAYEQKKYSDLVRMVAKSYGLKCGTVDDTKYVIGKRLEDGALFDILGNAADETLAKKSKMFVLYDDFGRLTLKNIESMVLPIMIDGDTASSYQYTTSIDKDVYTRVQIARDNNESGERELYVANNQKTQQEYGILQLYESGDATSAELKETAKALLKYHSAKRRTLKLSKCFGDIRVRGGSSLVVMLNLDDMKINNYMIVEKVNHNFSKGMHTMDLDVSGIRGEFIV